MRITKSQARLYGYLKNDYIQHFLHGCGVFMLILGAFVFHTWYRKLSFSWDTFLLIFRDSIFYTLTMSFPVYFNFFLFLVYRGRIDKIIGWKVFPRPELKGWGFPLFMLVSLLTALIFAITATDFLNNQLTIVKSEWYGVFVACELLILISTGAAYTKETIESVRALERKTRLEDIRRHRELEKTLDFIRKQIRPHFLFNTLQNLKILAFKKSDDLPMLMDQLSLLLRYLFTEANKKLVSVEKEIEFIRGYVELERLSLSRDTELTFRVEGFQVEREMPKIAPMLLLNVVENCFKHYNKSSQDKKRIEIRIRCEKDKLILFALNSFESGMQNEHQMFKSNGVGLKTLSESLTLIYGKRYKLETKNELPYFIVHLQVPFL